MKAPTPAEVTAALLEQWALIAAAIPDLDLTAPSRLPGWDGAALLGHTSGTVERLVAVASAPCPGEATLDAVSWWSAPDEPAPDGPGDAERFGAAVEAATEVLDTVPPDRVVGPGIRAGDHARTRLLEATVHGLDLGVPPARPALRLTVRLFVEILAARQPGRSVELRVPPFAAVQAVAGPRHTRGTPPAVVEADPVAWIEVAAGRRSFTDAVADGDIRASGGRSDLTAYLPLL